MEARSRVENPETAGAEAWAEYLLTLMETLYEGRLPAETVAELRDRIGAVEFQNREPDSIRKWVEDLIGTIE